ncbi:MAG: o-succinylbenzoate synthase [Aurantibacter sp.]
MKALYKKYKLEFKRPSGTSRGVLKQRETWFLVLREGKKMGIGECGLLKGLSVDDVPGYEQKLKWTCDNISLGKHALRKELKEFPSIQFGLEQAFLSMASPTSFELFPSDFTKNQKSVPINGLVWMGDQGFMQDQIEQKLSEGFRCIKLKIGAIDFEQEISLLSSLRKKYTAEELEIRVDANGAFQIDEALTKLKTLADFELHSIEQPIQQGNLTEMKRLCEATPLPIALDEELIGVFGAIKKEELLRSVRPHYIILKPCLVGGYRGSEEWISLADKYSIGWWVTSALESNIGLNAIAQWTYTLENSMIQGLGTGSLYSNNIGSPLTVKNGHLYYDRTKKWNTNQIEKICT